MAGTFEGLLVVTRTAVELLLMEELDPEPVAGVEVKCPLLTLKSSKVTAATALARGVTASIAAAQIITAQVERTRPLARGVGRNGLLMLEGFSFIGFVVVVFRFCGKKIA